MVSSIPATLLGGASRTDSHAKRSQEASVHVLVAESSEQFSIAILRILARSSHEREERKSTHMHHMHGNNSWAGQFFTSRHLLRLHGKKTSVDSTATTSTGSSHHRNS